jgi:hypothetical protein
MKIFKEKEIEKIEHYICYVMNTLEEELTYFRYRRAIAKLNECGMVGIDESFLNNHANCVFHLAYLIEKKFTCCDNVTGKEKKNDN